MNVAEDVINVDIVDLDNEITNVLVSGRMDVQGALAVDKKFSAIADEKKKVVIDLFQVTLRDRPVAEISSRIFSTVDSFSQGAEQTDDITCIAIRRRPKACLTSIINWAS